MRAGAERSRRVEQRASEDERREIVDREPELDPVAAQRARGAAAARSDAGVVDERVETLELGCEPGRHRTHLGERREIGLNELETRVTRRGADCAHGVRPASRIATVQQQSRTAASEVLREMAAEAVGRAGDEDRLLRERSHGSRRVAGRVLSRMRFVPLDFTAHSQACALQKHSARYRNHMVSLEPKRVP